MLRLTGQGDSEAHENAGRRVDVVLVTSAQEVIDHEMIDDVDTGAYRLKEHFEARSEPEDEVRVGRSVPGYAARSDEEQRADFATRELVSENPAIVPGGDAAPGEAIVHRSYFIRPPTLIWSGHEQLQATVNQTDIRVLVNA